RRWPPAGAPRDRSCCATRAARATNSATSPRRGRRRIAVMLHFFFALLLSRQQVWANEVAKFPEKGWLALTDVALVPVNLHIVVTDPREPKMLTVESGVTDPILLVHGVKGLQTGSVTAATIDGPEDPRPGDRLSIYLGGHHYQATFDAADTSATHTRVRLSAAIRSHLPS